MSKRFAISFVVTTVMLMGLGFFVHGFLLGPEYGRLTGMYRSSAEQPRYMPFMMLAQVITAFAFVWLYTKVKDDTPFLVQGVRYGLAVAALNAIPKFLIYYAVQPVPEALMIRQVLLDTVGLVLIGIVVARINR